MITNDNYPEPCIEPSLLVRYLIRSCQERIPQQHRGFRLVFSALGRAALHSESDLYEEFKKIPFTGRLDQYLRKSKDILVLGLSRLQDKDSDDNLSIGDTPVLSPMGYRNFLWLALRDAQRMIRETDFQYVSVWEVLAWIGLQMDSEKLRSFEQKCLQYSEPEEKVRQVIPILREALHTKRRTRGVWQRA